MKITYLFGLLLVLTCSGCAILPRNPPPIDKLYEAEVVGAPGVRAWGGIVSPIFQADIVTSVHQEKTGEFVNPLTGARSYSALAISGGGSDGAFGAGFLYGWSMRGNRPSFKLVTGISTGALIAPFAFLGSGFDEQLKRVFTTVDTNQIINRISLLGILMESESFTQSTPLINLIERNIDMELMHEVAVAHDNGRRLYIGTTHMDAQRLSIWNMGLIAKIGNKEALELFQKIMLASASIPVAMPPVYIDVEVGGEVYDEMHTDGGTTTQLFFHGGSINLTDAAQEAGVDIKTDFSRLYIIRNGQINSEPKLIPRNLKEISARTVDTSIKTAVLNNLFRMYFFAQQEHSEFYYVDIPENYVSEAKEPFDKEEMRRLFDVGTKMGQSPDPWNKGLPVFNSQQ